MTAEPTPEPSPPVATDEAAPAPEPPAARRIIEGDLVWVTYHGHKHEARVQRIDRWSPGDDVPERPPRYTVRYERTWTKRADDSEDESSAHSDASFDDEVEQAPASACSRCVQRVRGSCSSTNAFARPLLAFVLLGEFTARGATPASEEIASPSPPLQHQNQRIEK